MDGQTENVSISSFNKGRNRLIEKKTTTKSGLAEPGSHMAVPARRDGVFVRQSHHSAEAEQNSYVCFTILWHAANCEAEALKHADLTPQKKRHDRYMSIALRPRESGHSWLSESCCSDCYGRDTFGPNEVLQVSGAS